MSIALNARIRRATRRVIRHIRGNNTAFEVVTEIEDMVFYTEPISDATSVIDIGDRATTRVARPAPQFHGDTNDFMAGLH